MKAIACLSIFALVLSFCPAMNDHAYAWVEGKELAVVPASKETVDILRENNVDIEHILEGKIRIWATPEELAMLKRRGILYTILHEEMQAERDFFNQWKARRDSSLRSLAAEVAELDYHSYSDMVAALQDLEITIRISAGWWTLAIRSTGGYMGCRDLRQREHRRE